MHEFILQAQFIIFVSLANSNFGVFDFDLKSVVTSASHGLVTLAIIDIELELGWKRFVIFKKFIVAIFSFFFSSQELVVFGENLGGGSLLLVSHRTPVLEFLRSDLPHFLVEVLSSLF